MTSAGTIAVQPAAVRGPLPQLHALVALRRTMLRSTSRRRSAAVGAASVPLLVVGSAFLGRAVPVEVAFDLSLLAPTVFLGFALLSLLSPLSAGGGHVLFPAEQLVAFPVRPATQFLAGLVVLPLNIAWLLQLLAVCATAFLLVPARGAPAAAAVVLAYVAAVSLLGQVVTAAVVGLRRTRRGRAGVWGGTAALLGVVVLAVRNASPGELLDASPTTRVVVAVIEAGEGRLLAASDVAGLLVLACLAAAVVGARTTAWAERRPGDQGVRGAAQVHRRRPDRLVDLRSLDRRSVWRAPALRRGAIVLGLLPGSIAALGQPGWATLVLLPGLVIAGSALLFGVNAFCLDGTGAVWLASLPHPPTAVLRAKTAAVAEACLVAAAIALLTASTRAEQLPQPAELSALVAAVLATTATTVGHCLHWSLHRPHRADLRGNRDTPAPPGAMAGYSIRLALSTTLLGLVLAGCARTGVWWLPLLVGFVPLALGLRRIVRAWREWEDPLCRARVVLTVAHG